MAPNVQSPNQPEHKNDTSHETPNKLEHGSDVGDKCPKPEHKNDTDDGPPKPERGSDTNNQPSNEPEHGNDMNDGPPKPEHKNDTNNEPSNKPAHGSNTDDKPPKPEHGSDIGNECPKPEHKNGTDDGPPQPKHGSDTDDGPPKPKRGNDTNNEPPNKRKRGSDADNKPPKPAHASNTDNEPPKPEHKNDSNNEPPNKPELGNSTDNECPKPKHKSDADGESFDKSEHGSDTDDESAASTDCYSDHEPFDTYKDKVLQLCRLLWPNYPPHSFVIERMKGGTSNRIVGIRVLDTDGIVKHAPQKAEAQECDRLDLPPGDYVLRIPRWASENLQHEMATLRFLASHISVEIPTVVHHDTNSGGNNPLDSPYVLQNRIPGQRLHDMWETLNHTQRLLICLDMARVCTQLAKITNKSGGIPDVRQGIPADGILKTIDIHFPGDDKNTTRYLDALSPVDLLSERLNKWGNKYPRDDGTSPYYEAVGMVRHMQATNHAFGDDDMPYYLDHGDLFPRNIMVEVSGKNAAYVTGILDWDSVRFAPAVISFSPPAWLWVPGFWKNYSKEDFVEEQDLRKTAGLEPKDEESKEIKALFDSVVGSPYLRYAYSPHAATTRDIWEAAYETVGKSWVESEVEAMCRDWAKNQGKANTS